MNAIATRHLTRRFGDVEAVVRTPPSAPTSTGCPQRRCPPRSKRSYTSRCCYYLDEPTAGLGVTVMISARVDTFQEAYQLGGVVVMPLVALVIAQVSGVLEPNVALVPALGLVLWIANLILLQIGFRLFDRNRLAVEL
jgi:hypothetical protein